MKLICQASNFKRPIATGSVGCTFLAILDFLGENKSLVALIFNNGSKFAGSKIDKVDQLVATFQEWV